MREPLYAQQSRSLIWRRRVVALGAFLGAIVAIVIVVTSTLGGGGGSSASSGFSLATLRGHPVMVAAVGHLSTPVQQAAGAPEGAGGMLVLGGRDQSGAAPATIQRLDSAGTGRVAGRLPSGLVGAGAAELASAVYLFGGGSAPVSDGILAVPGISGGSIRQVSRLPRAAADAAVTAVGGTAFVIGGFDGSQQLDGVFAWQPGGAVHRTAHLAAGLRYASAASVGDVVIIAGGVSGTTTSRSILRFDPARHRVTQIGQLPVALAHAAAASLGGLVFVIGGRRGGPGTATRAIYAIDPATGAARFAGALPAPLADAAAARVGDRILIAGGSNRAGRVQSAVLALQLP